MSNNNDFSDNSVQYEDRWAEAYLLPEVKKVADFSLRQFVKYFDHHNISPYTGEELVRPLRWGADVRIEHDKRRIYVTEWYTPTADGKITVDDTNEILPGVHFREYVVSYHMAKDIARRAHQSKGMVNIGLCYIPVFKNMGDKFIADTPWLEEVREVAHKRVKQAVTAIQGEIKNLEEQYGKQNDEGLYIGVLGVYNRETEEVEYVVQKHDAIHFIKNENIEQNHIALKADVHGYDQTPFYHEKDVNKINWGGIMSRLVAEKVGTWVRVTHPSPVAIDRLSTEISEHLLPQVTEVLANAEEEVSRISNLVPGSIRHMYNETNSGLETHYKVTETQKKIVAPASENVVEGEIPEFSGEETEIDVVVDKQYDHGRNKALVLLVAGRIEPELWIPTQDKFGKAFRLKYSTTAEQSYKELLENDPGQ